MAVPLRHRRREQTARDIQDAALSLVRQSGLDHVTTEAIAAAAGISPRTFFNYFPNKEAALVGPPLQFEPASLSRFVTARAPLIDDFAELIRAQIEANACRKESIRLIDAIIDANPSLAHAFDHALHDLTSSIEAALHQRLGTGVEPSAPLLAQVFSCAAAQTFRLWGHDPGMTPNEAAAMMRGQLSATAQAMAA